MPTLQSVTHTYNLVFLKIAAEFSGIKATIVDFFFSFQISQYLKEEFARDGKKRHPSVHDEILADIFKKNDHDGDGFISAKEYNVYQHDEL